jgi:tRNA pseudouridine13 synthase
VDELAYLHGKPQVTGVFRQQPEHFAVTELLTPQGEPQGEHQWLWVEKRGANTAWVASQLAVFAGVHERQVSYAGLKDRHAVTRQWYSIQLPGQPLLAWQQLEHPEFKVLEARLQPKKLKSGAHKGNHFSLELQQLSAMQPLVARWQQIVEQGVPNYFGPQRFGRQGQNIAKARAWFSGQLRQKLSRTQSGLLLSSARAFLFNQIASARIAAQRLAIEPGDALMLAGSHSFFVADDIDQTLIERLQTGDIQLTAALPGSGRNQVRGAIAEFEQQIIGSYSDLLEGLQKHRVDAARRPLLVRLVDAQLTQLDDQRVRLDFALPSGSFATSVLRELMVAPTTVFTATTTGHETYDEVISE